MNLRSKILVVRTDKLGDVLLFVAVIEYLRSELPEAVIDFHFSPNFSQTLGPYLEAKGVRFVNPGISWPVTFRKESYDAVLILCGAGSIARAAFFARIPVRVGMRSRPMSFVYYNCGIRQKRSLAEKNEAQYNLDLAAILVERLTGRKNAPNEWSVCLPENPAARNRAVHALQHLGISPGQSFVIVHPGMAGSALNPSLDSYQAILSELKDETIILSIGPHANDRAMKYKLLEVNPKTPVLEGLDLPSLGEVFRLAKAVVAPSTGPIHLAHYVGASTIGLYSPVRSHHPKRWAPWGGAGKSQIVYPTVDCPGLKDCVGARCPLYYCMDEWPWRSLILPAANGLKI